MRAQNLDNAELNEDSVSPSAGTRNVRKTLLPSQVDFIDLVISNGTTELAQSLKCVHNFALYYSDVPVDDREKEALFDLKLLWEGLEKIKENH